MADDEESKQERKVRRMQQQFKQDLKHKKINIEREDGNY